MSFCNLPEPFTAESYECGIFKAQHEIHHASGKLNVQSVVEDFEFFDEYGKPEAVVNTISFIRTDAAEQARPVMFIWNGGPGSSSSVLHLECFGPYLIDKDPDRNYLYGISEEKSSIIDVCDLVYVDPVGTGYSRLLNPEKKSKYFSVDGDARATAFVISYWLKRHQRFNSPLYLCGESYGTLRACRVLAELGRSPFSESRMALGIPVAGVILIGLACSIPREGYFGKILEDGLDLLTAALPSMAAVHWYHNLREANNVDQKEFVDEAWRFAREELRCALFEGDACSDDRIKAMANKLSFYTGMDEEYFVAHRLQLASMDDFMLQVVRKQNKRVDVFDAQKAVSLDVPYNQIGDENIPLMVMNSLIANKLEVQTERLYFTGNFSANVLWEYKTEDLGAAANRSHYRCLSDAMKKNPNMKVLVASGLYDMCTLAGNTRYAMTHNGIPQGQLIQREYQGGHAVYSNAASKQAFLQDIRDLMK